MARKKKTKLEFDQKEVAEALVLYAGIKEGLWSLGIQYGFGVGAVKHPEEDRPVPTAMTSILSLGIRKVEKEGFYTVDAAKVAYKTSGQEEKKKSRAPRQKKKPQK